MFFCYNARNPLADGCTEPSDAGLSRAGREIVADLNGIGVVLDLSHMGARSAMEAVRISRAPVVLTHSNPRRLCDNPRNVSDELMTEVATTGGVVGVSPLPMLLTRKA